MWDSGQTGKFACVCSLVKMIKLCQIINSLFVEREPVWFSNRIDLPEEVFQYQAVSELSDASFQLFSQ